MYMYKYIYIYIYIYIVHHATEPVYTNIVLSYTFDCFGICCGSHGVAYARMPHPGTPRRIPAGRHQMIHVLQQTVPPLPHVPPARPLAGWIGQHHHNHIRAILRWAH